DAHQARQRNAEFSGDAGQRLDLADLALLGAIERGARNAELFGKDLGRQPLAQAVSAEPGADVAEPNPVCGLITHTNLATCGYSRVILYRTATCQSKHQNSENGSFIGRISPDVSILRLTIDRLRECPIRFFFRY